MVIIRFSRGGRKNLPRYKILVADQRSKTTGRYIESVGYYIPRTKSRDHEYRIDIDRIIYWLSKGAQLSDRVRNLLKSSGEYKKLPINKKQKRKANTSTKPIETKQNNTKNTLKDEDDTAGYNHKKNIKSFNERIKSIDRLSDVTIAEIRTLNNQGEWGEITTTSSLVPTDATSMTDWPYPDNITFKKFHRYILVNRDTGKIAWARIAKTRITYYCNSIQWPDAIIIGGRSWNVTYRAIWDDIEADQSNLSIKLTVPYSSDDATLTIRTWFNLTDIDILDSTIAATSQRDKDSCASLESFIGIQEMDFKEIILNHISQPFKYTSKLVGVQASQFFEATHGIYRVRAGLLNKHPIISVEKYRL
jgi:small subunit ribosomal protein S16